MLHQQSLPAGGARVHTGGQAPAGKTVKTVTSIFPPAALARALRKLLRDLVVFAGTSINDLASTPRRKPSQTKRQRLLYRRADSLTDADLDRLVANIGVERIWRAVDRLTQPPLPFMTAAE